MLSNYGLQEYILTAPRENLISQNREGICSWIGYLALYIVPCAIGKQAIFRYKATEKQTFVVLSMVSIIGWICTFLSELYVTQASRRMVCCKLS